MEALSTMGGQCFEVVETSDPEVFRRPVFAHFRIGQNRDPFSKCQAFAQVINAGVGKLVDIAFFKFCYVDITAHADIHELFTVYQDIMASLIQHYPKVVFLHATVPLKRVRSGVLEWVREKRGGFDREREAQARRHAFNLLLRGAYGGSGRLFDFAELEATFPDGRPSSFTYHGEAVPNLVSDYSDDGGHLNQRAAERAARGLLACLGEGRTEPGTSREGQGHS